MATQQQDLEYNQMSLNGPGWGSQSVGPGTHDSFESHGSPSKQRVEVTVLRASNVPTIKKYLFLKRKVFVTISTRNPNTMAKTADVRVERHMAKWDQTLDPILVQSSPPSHLTICLYAKRSTHPDILIGINEMQIPLASRRDIPCVLENGDVEAARPTQPVTLYTTVNITPEEGPIQGGIQFPVPEPFLPVETGPTITMPVHIQFPVPEPLYRSDTWAGAVESIKWVMDALGPVAELSPSAKMAHNLLSAIPQTLLEQYQHDDNVQTLLRAMHDGFNFAHHEDPLLIKSIKPESDQARIFTIMLQDVCSCCDFIRSYAKDPQFWKRTSKNTGGGLEEKVKRLSDLFVKRRKAFLGQATMSPEIEITAFRILHQDRP